MRFVWCIYIISEHVVITEILKKEMYLYSASLRHHCHYHIQYLWCLNKILKRPHRVLLTCIFLCEYNYHCVQHYTDENLRNRLDRNALHLIQRCRIQLSGIFGGAEYFHFRDAQKRNYSRNRYSLIVHITRFFYFRINRRNAI